MASSGLYCRLDSSLKYQWISWAYRQDENADEWANYLERNCVWKIECFCHKYPWYNPIPPVEKWDQEVKELNQHLIMISRRL